jgi:hypothetical protein
MHGRGDPRLARRRRVAHEHEVAHENRVARLRRRHGQQAAIAAPPGSGISTGFLTLKRGFNTVLEFKQGF